MKKLYDMDDKELCVEKMVTTVWVIIFLLACLFLTAVGLYENLLSLMLAGVTVFILLLTMMNYISEIRLTREIRRIRK